MVGIVGAERQRVARRPRVRVGKHLGPFAVQRRAARGRVLHPEIHLDDVVDAAASGLDAELDLLEDVADLPGEVGRHGARLGIAAADDARHQDAADAAGIGDGVFVLEAGIVDALALGHLR